MAFLFAVFLQYFCSIFAVISNYSSFRWPSSNSEISDLTVMVKDIANSGLVLHNTRSRLVAQSALNSRIITPCVLTLNT